MDERWNGNGQESAPQAASEQPFANAAPQPGQLGQPNAYSQTRQGDPFGNADTMAVSAPAFPG